ncbi:S-layer homology domain-containing protein [Tuberibacillus calidus]|uniref:S-layer homology domain-containing protein n=1 Tax=Tuberibacillus calidus TaxID=340097 RepID=UPI0004236DE3|nr:S-layer homology domain-containing protein [Tuberibacillus calidus]
MAYQPKSYRKFLAASVSAVVAASAIAPVAASAASNNFKDVQAGTELADAVNYLVSTGTTNGESATEFGVHHDITRAQAAKMIAGVMGLDTKNVKDPGFPDVSKDNYYYSYIAAAANAGVFQGDGAGKFNPDKPITRAEAAKVFVKAFGLELKADAKTPFTDVPDASDKNLGWATPYINTLYADGLVKGTNDAGTTYEPNGNLDRGSFALLAYRVHQFLQAPQVTSVSAINSTQAVVQFNTKIGDVDPSNFTVDNGVSVISAKVDSTDKTKVTITFNKALEDKTTYTVTVNGVTSDSGVTQKEASSSTFTYETAEVNSISLDQTSFNSSTGLSANLLDYVTIKDEKGRDVTSEILNDITNYTVSVYTTDAKIVETNGDVVADADGSAYVEIKVINNNTSKVVATTGAVKVTVAPYQLVSLEGIHLSDSSASVADYKTAKANGEVNTTLQESEDGKYLNVFVTDSAGNIVKLDATNAKITNLTPTVAIVSESGGEFEVNAIAPGTAKVQIEAGGFKTTVTFNVVADSKVTSGDLDVSSLTLTTDTNSPSYTGTVTLSLKDQYGNKIAADDSKVVVRYSKAGIVNVSKGTAVDNKVLLTVTAYANGSTTVYVDYKDANDNVIFTKSFSVTVKDFGTAAKYDLVVSSTSADYLDADNDANDTGVDKLDNEVKFELYQVDSNGNRVAKVDLDGTNNQLVLDVNALTDDEKALFNEDTTTGLLSASGAYDTLTFADPTLAQETLTKSGTVKVTALVNGVAVDSVNVTYKNTDSVASSASILKTSLVVDKDNVDNVSDLLFGIYNSSTSSYSLNPLLTIKDQSGKVLTYNVASSSAPDSNVDGIYNGLKVSPTWVSTNENNVTVDPSTGVITLQSGKSSGTFTLVLSKVQTLDGSSNVVNKDLLSAPVAIEITVVE